MSIQDVIEKRLPAVADLRHRLHRIPELAFEEHKTAAAIREQVDGLGIAHVDGVPGAETATIAWIGDTRKPCIALRADIDALPIDEQTGCEYCSTHPGCMHAWPALKVGTVATKPGPLLAATDNFLATFIGKGTHGAYPHLGADPIVA